MKSILLAVLRKDLKNALSYKLNFVFSFFGIFAASFVFFYFSKLFEGAEIELLQKYGNNYFLFVIFGIAITDISFLISRSISNEIRNSQLNGNLEEIILSGSSSTIIMIGSTIYPFLFGLLKFLIYILIAKFLYQINDLSFIEIISLIFLFIQIYISFSGIALIAGAFTIYFKKGDPINSLMFAANSVFAGVLFPTEVLPRWGELISFLIPTKYSIEITRGILIENNVLNIYCPMLILSTISVFFITIGAILIKLAIIKSKLKGNITDY